MYHYKQLILILLSSIILKGDSNSFRGKSKNDVLGQKVPISFVNMISNNYEILPNQINPQRGSYLIIAPDGIINYLNDFVSFKKSQGFDVYVSPLSESNGTSDGIKATIESIIMEDPMLEYVLLIGDVDGFSELPSFYYGPENDVTDQKFTHIYGNDNIPDVFIGRLSIDSLSDLAVIMSKTIKYATDPLAYNADWLSRGIIVAGNYSNTYPIPITPKWTSYWLRDELISHGYSQVDTVFYPPIQQGAPYIIPLINNGAGIVNYRGWGDANGWHYPEFHVDDVNDLNNGWLTPVFMSYVCNSNDFANNVDPCLAEAIIRGGTPTVPKGGVAFVGPSDLHTSTKYNNVINAYMYDAMLNYGVVELGPAMQAGQSGLVKEFPAQSGPGEAQEFYSHVYNILGDPSIQVYLDTPQQFTINVNNVSNLDGFVQLVTLNPMGVPISNAVISIMSNDEILAKGISDTNGAFAATLDLSAIESLDIYANKPAFIQGKKTIAIQNQELDLVLSDIVIQSENSDQKPSIGSLVNMSFNFQNISTTATVNGFSGVIRFSDDVQPNIINIEIPNMTPGELVNINDIQFTAYNTEISNSILAVINNGIQDIATFSIAYEIPVFDISFENNPEPNSSFPASLFINNYSNSKYDDVFIKITGISDGALTSLNETLILSEISPFEFGTQSTNYNIQLSDVAFGSQITFLVELLKNDVVFYHQEVALEIPPVSANYPVAPNNFGYWAYDDTDEGFANKPTFDWVELDPNYNGMNGTHYQLGDDDHVDLELPFTFKYHGIDYNNITVNSNGWASFEQCEIDYFWNMSIPMYMGPKALLAPFSDDLETLDTDGDGENDIWINIYTSFDNTNGRFIIEWSRALNGYDEITEETFQIILYTQGAIPTESGNGVIEFQYLEIDDVDVTKNYSTVGIESPEKNYGLQYVFNNVYAPGAAVLEDQRVIRFTTDAPTNYIAPLAVESDFNPTQFQLSPSYPNPFNPSTNLTLIVPITEKGEIVIVDILGREVALIHRGTLVEGQYNFSWHGKNNAGNSLSSGTYFAIAKFGQTTKVQKLLLLK